MSKSYTIEFSDGSVSEGFFSNDADAISWVESIVGDGVAGDWEANGQSDSGRHERMLFWASEEAAESDPGANAYCQLCVIR